MAAFFHLIPYLIAAAIALLLWVIFGGGDSGRADRKPRRESFHRWDDDTTRR